jgi:hypothetical protein
MTRMKFWLLFLVFVYARFDAFAQQSDRDRAKLNGPVMSYDQTSYEAVEKKGRIKKGEPAYRLPSQGNRFVAYTEEGYVAERKEINLQGEVTSHKKFTYDQNNSMNAAIYYADGLAYVTRDSNVYDDQGLRLAVYSCDEPCTGFQMTNRYTYDDYGYLVWDEFNLDDSIDCGRNFYVNYPDGRPQEIRTYYNCQDSVYSARKYTYDDKGNISEESLCRQDGKTDLTEAHMYNEQGHHTQMVVTLYMTEPAPRMVFTYEYVYDKYGNWIQKIEYLDGVPKYIIERKITYYN